MPSTRYGRSIRDVLLVIVFQLGLCLIVLGDVATAARGYGETVPGVTQILGGVTAVGAVPVLLAQSAEVSDTEDPHEYSTATGGPLPER